MSQSDVIARRIAALIPELDDECYDAIVPTSAFNACEEIDWGTEGSRPGSRASQHTRPASAGIHWLPTTHWRQDIMLDSALNDHRRAATNAATSTAAEGPDATATETGLRIHRLLNAAVADLLEGAERSRFVQAGPSVFPGACHAVSGLLYPNDHPYVTHVATGSGGYAPLGSNTMAPSTRAVGAAWCRGLSGRRRKRRDVHIASCVAAAAHGGEAATHTEASSPTPTQTSAVLQCHVCSDGAYRTVELPVTSLTDLRTGVPGRLGTAFGRLLFASSDGTAIRDIRCSAMCDAEFCPRIPISFDIFIHASSSGSPLDASAAAMRTLLIRCAAPRILQLIASSLSDGGLQADPRHIVVCLQPSAALPLAAILPPTTPEPHSRSSSLPCQTIGTDHVSGPTALLHRIRVATPTLYETKPVVPLGGTLPRLPHVGRRPRPLETAQASAASMRFSTNIDYIHEYSFRARLPMNRAFHIACVRGTELARDRRQTHKLPSLSPTGDANTGYADDSLLKGDHVNLSRRSPAPLHVTPTTTTSTASTAEIGHVAATSAKAMDPLAAPSGSSH